MPAFLLFVHRPAGSIWASFTAGELCKRQTALVRDHFECCWLSYHGIVTEKGDTDLQSQKLLLSSFFSGRSLTFLTDQVRDEADIYGTPGKMSA